MLRRSVLEFCGVRLVDTASFYGNEREVGSAVRGAVKNLSLIHI
mgnify:CR=1 FL=1